jgi:hypothetical protein
MVGEIVTESWMPLSMIGPLKRSVTALYGGFCPPCGGSLPKTDRSGTVWISKVVVSPSVVPPIAWACPSNAPRYTVLRASKLSGLNVRTVFSSLQVIFPGTGAAAGSTS